MSFVPSLLPDIFASLCMKQMAGAKSLFSGKTASPPARSSFADVFADVAQQAPKTAPLRQPMQKSADAVSRAGHPGSPQVLQTVETESKGAAETAECAIRRGG